MPSDIRSFFSGKGSQGAASSQEKASAKGKQDSAKSKGRGKRRIVSDSEDDEGHSTPKKATPKKAAAKKVKQESPKVEITSTGDYFASTNKPSRSTAAKSRNSTKKEDDELKAEPNPKSTRASTSTPKSEAKNRKDAGSASNRSSRTTTRNVVPKSYVEVQESEEDDIPIIKRDENSGEDVFEADYKRHGKKMEDDYESTDGEDVSLKEKVNHKPTNGRKRKSGELSDEDEGVPKKANGIKATPKKPAQKKAKTPQRKEELPECKEIQDIFDSIPIVQAPSPPPRDESKKLDWRAKMNRTEAQPPQAGTKEIPEGADNCLVGLAFVFTGVLDSLGREEGQSLVKRYGGKVTGSPSSKTDYVVLGTDAGPKKLETIQKLNIKTVNEEGLFALIQKLPANGGSGKNAQKSEERRQAEEKKVEAEAEKLDREIKKQEREKAKTIPDRPGKPAPQKVDDQLWTTKYAPTQTNQICGNKTQVDKLQKWLRTWKSNAASNFKKGGPDGSGLFRAVMLHGGPGIGKTTAAHLAAKLEGFDIVESNASDTRSKKLIEGGLRGVLDTTSLLGYFAGDGKNVDVGKKNLVLIMDEVDGMSAGDRGGVGAMAAICRKTSIPIILICNDRKLPKMKPFDHVTYDLPFRKPTVDQVRSRIMTILFREGMKDMIPVTVVNSLIEGSGSDIRRIINMISTAKVDAQKIDFAEGKKMASAWEKHVILKPWDITQKILGGGMFAQSSKATLNDKIELYFNDHEFSSLMLQENYLSTNPINAHQYAGKEKNLKLLDLADNAAQSISDGDLCDAMIHGSQQHWSLMPTHAVFSFVRPASFISGNTAGNVRFTSWLGNNSKMGKLSRFVKEIQSHMRLRCAADRHEIRQQYLPVLWARLVKGLELHGDEPSGIDTIIALMDSYFLTKDDWDAIYDLGVGPQAVENVQLSSNHKSQFTRKYNAMSHPLPFMKAGSTMGPMKKSKDKPDLEEAIDESEDDELVAEVGATSDEEELDLKKDKYVQVPKKRKAPPANKKTAKKAKAKTQDDEAAAESEEEIKPPKAKAKAGGSKKK